jgi:magnesium-transporting ATPase (P-type)
MLWFDSWKLMVCLLILIFVIPTVLNILRLFIYYLGPSSPKYQKYLFRLNKMLMSLSGIKDNSRWYWFYFSMFFLVSLIGGYLLYEILEKIIRKEITIGNSWLMLLLVLIVICVALQELRPEKKKHS